MGDKEKAAEAKAKGNTAFQAKSYEEAIKHFTEAIKHDPSDHVFFSNRSACYASLEKYDEALKDGTECVRLKPDWAKGYTRKGLAEFFLKKYDDAGETYKAGLKISPEDPTLKEGLKKAMDAKYELPGSLDLWSVVCELQLRGWDVSSAAQVGAGAGSGGGGGGGGLGLSMDPAKLASAAAKNPKIKEYMQDAGLMQKVQMICQMGNSNQQMGQTLMMQAMQQDPRVLEVIMAMQGIDVQTAGPGGDFNFDEDKPAPPPKAPVPKKKEEEAPPPDNRTPEQKEADEFKAKGNELYKQKKFEEAIAMYDKALEKEPNDLTYYNNKCAVWIEMGGESLDKVLELCQDVLNRRYEINTANPGGASFEKVSKIYARMARVYEIQKKFDESIEMYNKALTEDNSRQTRNSLREVERAKEKFEKDSYLDTAKAEEAKERGNEHFKKSEWADAKREYDDAVKRNPNDPKLYSNRAAALTKLLAYPDALRDLDECLRLDPKFVKAYSRKGAAHFFMKEYHKALEAYERGLALEPDNKECKEGRDQVIAKIGQTQRSGEVDEEQVRHAMADPEIQNILKDPQINMFLKKMQEDPAEGQRMMEKDVKIANAVQKLMAAGVLRVG